MILLSGELKCSDVKWTGVIYVRWYLFLKWNEVSYGEVPGDKSTMYITMTFYWEYLIVLWLLHLVCVLCCGCFNLFCNVWVFWQHVHFYLLFGIVCTVFFVLLPLCIFILICFVCTSVRTTATQWQFNCSNNNNNNNNNNLVPRIRMCGAVPLLPLSDFTPWTTLYFYLLWFLYFL